MQIIFPEGQEDYARDGGKKDRTLDSWRKIYWNYIASKRQRIGRQPTPKAPLVMERFRVVYRKPLNHHAHQADD